MFTCSHCPEGQTHLNVSLIVAKAKTKLMGPEKKVHCFTCVTVINNIPVINRKEEDEEEDEEENISSDDNYRYRWRDRRRTYQFSNPIDEVEEQDVTIEMKQLIIKVYRYTKPVRKRKRGEDSIWGLLLN